MPKLTDAERSAVIKKLRELDADAWDRRIEEHAASGALDRMYEKLTGGETDTRPLDDFLNSRSFRKCFAELPRNEYERPIKLITYASNKKAFVGE